MYVPSCSFYRYLPAGGGGVQLFLPFFSRLFNVFFTIFSPFLLSFFPCFLFPLKIDFEEKGSDSGVHGCEARESGMLKAPAIMLGVTAAELGQHLTHRYQNEIIIRNLCKKYVLVPGMKHAAPACWLLRSRIFFGCCFIFHAAYSVFFFFLFFFLFSVFKVMLLYMGVSVGMM